MRDIAVGGGTLGDLGMVLENANPALAILQILPLPGGLGALGKLLGPIDEVTNLAAARRGRSRTSPRLSSCVRQPLPAPANDDCPLLARAA